MALVILGLISDGVTKVKKYQEMALRGYNKLEDKLRSLGIKISLLNRENLKQL